MWILYCITLMAECECESILFIHFSLLLIRTRIFPSASAHLFQLIMTTMTIMILARTEIAYNITLRLIIFLC